MSTSKDIDEFLGITSSEKIVEETIPNVDGPFTLREHKFLKEHYAEEEVTPEPEVIVEEELVPGVEEVYLDPDIQRYKDALSLSVKDVKKFTQISEEETRFRNIESRVAQLSNRGVEWQVLSSFLDQQLLQVLLLAVVLLVMVVVILAAKLLN